MNHGWIDVEQGRRPLDWAVCFGDPDEADYLTPAGRAVAIQAAADLEQFFGADWPHRAAHPPSQVPMVGLAQFCPSLQKAPGFAAAVALRAQLQLLVVDHIEGIGKLRDNLRSNPVRDEFRHGIAQARLAVQAHLAGARVVLEPRKPTGGPGDLLAVRAGSELFFEFRAIGPDDASIGHEQRIDDTFTFLLYLGSRYAVRWSGSLPAMPDDEWRHTVEEAAQHAAHSHTPVEVTTDGATLIVERDAGPAQTSLAGPRFEVDQEHRLVRAVVRKAIQTEPARAAWIWLEDHGALWPKTAFASYSLTQKVTALADTLSPVFAAHPHLLGVVLTSDTLRLDGPVEPATERQDRGAAFLRTLPDGRVRQSVVVHRPLVVPGQYALACQLCTEEPSWLDNALARLGVPGGIASLTTAAMHPAMADDRPRRSPEGLYLPR